MKESPEAPASPNKTPNGDDSTLLPKKKESLWFNAAIGGTTPLHTSGMSKVAYVLPTEIYQNKQMKKLVRSLLREYKEIHLPDSEGNDILAL